ncbi:uroporphyrinogen decarboxylase family protein [Moorella sp. Hama-1]|uniref:uroporphyrinogen decarboxylase family protein n=1 Tax=Moorella sp. Hama-1 TaxID=2138101 RepID=UPI000D64AC3C|nr:uroporphyrinogen decarboxylase family protein [Moorella sp. Hama-1]BCV22267.1 uroporphyrinogen decarboxylase [Moorella sp. Hama-1]
MNHRERVLAVLNHQEPDLVPLDLCNTASFINDPAYFALKEYLHIEGDVAPFRKGFTGNYYDERVLAALDIDFRHVWLKPPAGYQQMNYPDGTFSDEWGVLYRLLGNERAIMRNPLSGADVDAIDKYPWPDPAALGRTDGLAEKARYLYEETDYAVAAHAAYIYGLFDNAWILRGFEEFMTDLMINKDFARRLLRKILDLYLEFYDLYLDEVGPYVHLVVHAEDYGMQAAPFISPKLYAEMFLPLHKELFSFIKKKAPQAKIMLHSCGAVYPLIPLFIEAGIDVLNPIQHLAEGMDPARIKKEFGSEIVFHGGIDIQQALGGSVEDVRKEAKARIDDLGRGGGYIVAPANIVQAEVPPENIVTLYKTAREYGRYNSEID